MIYAVIGNQLLLRQHKTQMCFGQHDWQHTAGKQLTARHIWTLCLIICKGRQHVTSPDVHTAILTCAAGSYMTVS